METFGRSMDQVYLQKVTADDQRQLAETAMRNQQNELAMMRLTVDQREFDLKAELQAAREHMAREKQEGEAEIIKRIEAEKAEEMGALMEKLKIKAAEVETKEAEAEEEGERSEYMQQVSQNQEFKTAFKPIDELLKKDAWKERIEASERFEWKRMGYLSMQELRKKGMIKLPTQQAIDKANFSEAQEKQYFEVMNWQAAIDGEEMPYSVEVGGPDVPCFSIRDAFHFMGGSYATICEHDIPRQEQKPHLVYEDGEVIATIPRPPIPGHDASFVRSIRERFKKKADGILHYLRDKVNDYQSCGTATGYSKAEVAWDKVKDQPMSYAQKVAFILEHAAQLDNVFDGDLRREVPGFEGFEPAAS